MRHERMNEKSLIPLMVTAMAVVAPLLFILGLVVGNHLQGNASLTADSISSWLSAIATVAIAILTFILAKETWYLREAQIKQLEELKRESIRPNVGVQLESSNVGVNFMNVKIHNLGKGIAQNISIKFLDRTGAEINDDSDVVVEKFRRLAIFRHGVKSMGIGQEISSYVFSFIDLGSELSDDLFKQYIHISIEFEDVDGTPYSNAFVIDFAQFEGISELGGNDLYKIATEIKKIREELGRGLKLGRNRIGVNIFDSKDRQEELDLKSERIADAVQRQQI
ncbi:hypothetical protein D3C76_1077590 [compost metagenome]